MPGSVRIARILGIDIRIHVSWILIFFLVVLSLSESIFPEEYPLWSRERTFTVAAITAALFFGSVLAHELAHSIVARGFRMSVSSITLFLLGGVANLTREPPSARAEFFMAAAGPATSVAIGLAGKAVALAIGSAPADGSLLQAVRAVADYLGTINLYVAAFNLIPGFPLDGGRVLRSAIWGIRDDRVGATAIAARGGQVVAAGFVALAGLFLFGVEFELFGIQFGGTFNGIWFGIIAYFLFNAASSSLQQERIVSTVGQVRVAQLMTTDYRSTSKDTTVGVLIRDLVLPLNLRAIPVVSADRVEGLVTIGDLRKVEQDRWATTPVEAVMTHVDDLPTVTPDDLLTTALERFGMTELPLLPVMRGRELVGVLYRESVVGYVRMREMLGIDARR
jgi:Zn-dependent protease/CBS domain-containing protein